MVRRVVEAVSAVSGEVVVVSPRPVPGVEEGGGLVRRVADRVPGAGPLGGLQAALVEARARDRSSVLLLACDLPLVTPGLLRALLDHRGPEPAVVPRTSDGRLQLLCAAYSTALLPEVEARLAAGDRSMHGFFDAVGGRAIEASALGVAEESLLLNVNTPETRDRAERLLRRRAREEDGDGEPGPPPVVCVVGKKRSGKTTTVVGLVRALTARGHRVMTVKHGHHFRLDREGTDSWRHRHEGGAARVVLAGPEGLAMAGEWGPGGEEPLERLVARLLPDADLVVAEGFKSSAAPRIEVYRRSAHPEPLYAAGDLRYLALLTDVPGFEAHVPVLDVEDARRFDRLAELVEARLLP
jgi:molybdopterin-guanine dinucleotide biosynthesis protein B